LGSSAGGTPANESELGAPRGGDDVCPRASSTVEEEEEEEEEEAEERTREPSAASPSGSSAGEAFSEPLRAEPRSSS
jgi:3'-phosphoadenosine 5'-phosphosulfate sulfotransferase (PAPS reductase)/FAD synthetase